MLSEVIETVEYVKCGTKIVPNFDFLSCILFLEKNKIWLQLNLTKFLGFGTVDSTF